MGGERVEGAKGASVGKCWERVEVAGDWIGFRDYFGGYEVAEEVTLGFVDCFVCGL